MRAGLKRVARSAVIIAAVSATPAHAVTREVRNVFTTTVYGIGGGTILGLISYPFTRDPKTIFMGSSIGGYLGFAIGIYHISHRDDPGNPLHYGREDEDRRLAEW